MPVLSWHTAREPRGHSGAPGDAMDGGSRSCWIAVLFELLGATLWDLFLFALHQRCSEMLGPKAAMEFSLCCQCVEARML